MSAETIERLRALGDGVRFVMGNSDREVVEAFDTGPVDRPSAELPERWTRWTARQLTRADRDFLDSFEPRVTVNIDGLGETLFCHGSPRRDDEVITTLTSEARLAPMLAEVEQQFVVCGHTHVQFDRTILGKGLLNAGAVGLPYEGRPGAFWACLGPEIELCRTAYDVDAAMTRMSQTGFPELEELLNESLLEPLPAARGVGAVRARGRLLTPDA